MRVQLETPHNPDTDWHQWVYLNGFRDRRTTVRRDSLGRPHEHARREWLVIHCNNTECPAEAIVLLEDICDAAEAALPVPKRSTDA